MNESPLNPSEYHPYYAGYIAAVGNTPLPDALENSLHDITTFISGIPEHKRNFAYASGKWSVAEVLVHLMDAGFSWAEYGALKKFRRYVDPRPACDSERRRDCTG